MIYENESIDPLAYFSGKTIAILGYDDQGFQHAIQLLKYNIKVLVVLREGTNEEKWRDAGFKVVTVWDAVDEADILQVW